jgi:elongation factor P--(R)-beta-lysine ligase
VQRVHSPQDLRGLADGARILLAGRLVHVSSRAVTLADALRVCVAHLAPDARVPALGTWVVVSGLVRKQPVCELVEALVEAHSPGQLLPEGFFARFSRVGERLALRARAARAVRQFFEQRDYVEVSTPVRVRAPGTDVYLEPQPSEGCWLITSPEFHHKRLLAGGLPRIFELARCTRKGESGLWHHAEFTMLEWYTAFSSVNDLMAQTEELVRHIVGVLGLSANVNVQGRNIALDVPFRRLTVAQAFREYAGVDDVVTLAATDEDKYFQVMVDEIEPAVAQIPVPVFLTHYPESQAALAQQSSDFPGFADRFELFIGGVELCNGYGELTDANEQAARFAADVERRAQKGLPALPIDDELLHALREGVPPCSGNAVGFDRLVSVLLGCTLDDVVAFPPQVNT